MKTEKIELKKFVPNFVLCGDQRNEYSLKIEEKSDSLFLSYITNSGNGFKQNYSYLIPKYLTRDKETFEVLGLLQAEMGKTYNGCLVFANSEYKLVNKVLNWFKREFDLDFNSWRWYIRVNLVEFENGSLTENLQEYLKDYWLKKTKLCSNMAHPKTVCYVKETNNKILQNYGTIMIEYKSNLFSQVIKKYVNEMSFDMLNCSNEEICAFMKGIIAGESNVELNSEDCRYRVYISAVHQDDLDLYEACLRKLGIVSKQYQSNKLIVSKRKNNVKLLEQKLMTLSPKKYNKFRSMMLKYPEIRDETNYFRDKKNCVRYNKTPEEKVQQIISLSKTGLSSKEVAEKLGLHILKVQRVRSANNLGKRIVRTSKELEDKIVETHWKMPFLAARDIAAILKISEGRIWRVRRKYGLKLILPCRTKVPLDIVLRETSDQMRELDEKWITRLV